MYEAGVCRGNIVFVELVCGEGGIVVTTSVRCLSERAQASVKSVHCGFVRAIIFIFLHEFLNKSA